jgi:TRAP-type C4-dicarboxylate transport system permease small subunit
VNLTIKTLLYIFNFLEKINTFFLRIGRQFAWIAIFLMVVVIMIQVFFRYVLNNALPWPDEVARFLMLWMTGLIAPSAYRWGGFVSIDMLERFLPKIISTFLTLFLLIISLFVLIIGLELGLKHINVGWIFNSASIKIPFNLIGGKAEPIKFFK